MIKEAIQKIVGKQDLTYDEAYAVMNEIMDGETSQTQNAAFLAALSTKSACAETIDEISGCAAAMRAHATPVEHPGMEVMDIVGTGGDGAKSFNISTTAAIVVAAAGVGSQSMETARRPQPAAPPTAWRRSAPTFYRSRANAGSCLKMRAFAFFLRSGTTVQ